MSAATAAAVLRGLGRGAGAAAGASAAGALTLYVADRDAFDTAMRIRRTASVTSWMLSDYSTLHWRCRGGSGGGRSAGVSEKEEEERLAECHRRNAPLLRDLCFRNGGLYLKMGQLLGLMDHVIPEEYVHCLRGCFDACPKSSLADVEAVFLEELGRKPQEIFGSSFEEEPLASASLAQVHRAALPDGTQLAVKVQHRPLSRMARTETAAIDLILRAVRLVEPAFGFQWLVEEVRENLPKELNFLLEAENGARCRRMLEVAGYAELIKVPRTHGALSTKRILVMDFEEGKSLAAGRKAMEDEGVAPHSVVKRFAEAYAEMTFLHGFLHCDPHHANVLWRRRHGAPEGFELVLLDHGLYRELSDRLRLAYCRIWRAIALGDSDAALQATRSLGVRSDWLSRTLLREAEDGPGRLASQVSGVQSNFLDAEEQAGKMLVAMLTARAYSKVVDTRGGLLRFDRTYRGVSAESDREETVKHVAGYFRGILDVLDSIPRPLILIMKANDCLRSIASSLDVPPSVALAVQCSACCRALAASGEPGRWRAWLLSFQCWLFLTLEGSLLSRMRYLRHLVART